MRFTIVFLVLALAVVATKARDNEYQCACPKIFVPVCASNGKTYSNLCIFRCAIKEAKKQGNHNAEHELLVVYEGECSSNPNQNQMADDFLELYA